MSQIQFIPKQEEALRKSVQTINALFHQLGHVHEGWYFDVVVDTAALSTTCTACGAETAVVVDEKSLNTRNPYEGIEQKYRTVDALSTSCPATWKLGNP